MIKFNKRGSLVRRPKASAARLTNIRFKFGHVVGALAVMAFCACAILSYRVALLWSNTTNRNSITGDAIRNSQSRRVSVASSDFFDGQLKPVPTKENSTAHVNSTTSSLLQPFRTYERDPILPEVASTAISGGKVRVRVLLFEHKAHQVKFRRGPTWAIGDEMLNICMDGFSWSPYFELVNATIVPDFTLHPDFVLEEQQDIVWVVDMRRSLLKGTSYSIAKQLTYLANSTLHYQQQRATADPTLAIPSLKVVLMDYRDKIPQRTLCTRGVRDLISLLGVGNVRSVLQQVTRGREFSQPDATFVSPGHIWNSSHDNHCFGNPVLQVPYTVRSDYAEAIRQEFPKYIRSSEIGHVSKPISTNALDKSRVLLSSTVRDELAFSPSGLTPVDTERDIDVAHFWPIKKDEHCARLRNAVTELVLSLNGTRLLNDNDRPLHTIGETVSLAGSKGRTGVSREYVQALLTTKIVVVAQRDEWEDHYRLFEAFSGGALVMTDPMLSMPMGLVDGESIVVYHSLEQLRQLVVYYLAPQHAYERISIARRGWTIAMTQHRSYHWMERVFFGMALTK